MHACTRTVRSKGSYSFNAPWHGRRIYDYSSQDPNPGLPTHAPIIALGGAKVQPLDLGLWGYELMMVMIKGHIGPPGGYRIHIKPSNSPVLED
jgi:hypothetical protein